MACVLLFFCIAVLCFHVQAGARSLGVNYGLLGNNLPRPNQVVSLLKSKNIQQVRIFDPNHDVLEALENSDTTVVLGVRNEDLQDLSTDPSYAVQWVNTNVVPYVPGVKFRYVSAGNEVIPGPLAQFVLGAMHNLDNALKSADVSVPVSTAIHFQALGQSFPPSGGEFSEEAGSIMAPIVAFLASKGYPLLVNTYPYFAYASDPETISLDYALGNLAAASVDDGALRYHSLFDAMLDAMYSAIEKVGGENVRIVVAETGWPSAGNGDIATVANAEAYVNNVAAHVTSKVGTPKRPGNSIETYIFAVFNENLKPAGTEQNFGLYRPDMTEVYPFSTPTSG